MVVKINSLINDDCFNVLPHIADKSIDMILTDLPYALPSKRFTDNTWDVAFDLDRMWKELKRVVKDKGVICMNAAQPFTSYLIMSNLKDYRYNWIWVKGNSTGFLNAKKQPLRKYEDVCVFVNGAGQNTYNPQLTEGKAYTATRSHTSTNYRIVDKNTTTVNTGWRYPVNVLNIPEGTTKNHPTEKPVRLYEYMIQTYTNEGQTILDITAGSMTTAAACINTGRNYICIEKDAEYFNKGQLRISYSG
jgi:site-specific DNA-methyltransferase (adenine-specific)